MAISPYTMDFDGKWPLFDSKWQNHNSITRPTLYCISMSDWNKTLIIDSKSRFKFVQDQIAEA